MCHDHHEKWKKTNKGRNRTVNSRKHKNVGRKGKVKVPGNIGSG